MEKVKEYIDQSRKVYMEKKEATLHNTIKVIVKDPLPNNISLVKILDYIEKLIPKHLAYNIDAMYIGDFQFMREKEINAVYTDGALYIANVQKNESDLAEDIVHEISHAVEERYSAQIYQDQKLVEEFYNKRIKLFHVLQAYEYKVDIEWFKNMDYDEKFDGFLYQQVGYDRLEHFVMDLFLSPYAVTSVREYFGTAFEEYFLGKKEELAQISPVAYNKIEYLVNGDWNES
jgi:hypothetical protein|tara:strand:- start:15626 stop:16318 length:693 start_codon:yes stop_codon:yes gene_type:complete